ncbi:MAG: hypothetical protein ACU843_09250 [Gammaproteobacteria bacterium]
MSRVRLFILTLSACFFIPRTGHAEIELSGKIGLDFRYWMHNALFSEQLNQSINPSLLLQPELNYEWNDRNDSIRFTPWFRWDAYDKNRRFFDIREAVWRHRGTDWDLRSGIAQVFWGVVETRHLVNIINQVDTIEDVDEEDRLGQPMVNFTQYTDEWGTFDLFILPGFRERRFANARGRLRLTGIPIEKDAAQYESSLKDAHVDFAGRWSTVIDEWDIAVSHFYGTGREARLLPIFDALGNVVQLAPRYDIINQTGFEIQWTHGSWLAKLEAIIRSGPEQRLNAVVGGFEYTFYGVFDSDVDVGVLTEYLRDDRGPLAPLTPFQDDLFGGIRVALNDIEDTEILMGAIVDRSSGASLISIEAQRRLFEHFRLSLDSRLFINIPKTERALAAMRNDSFVNMQLAYYF